MRRGLISGRRPVLDSSHAPPDPPAPDPARDRLPVRSLAVGPSRADRRLDRRAHSAARAQGAARGLDRTAAAGRGAARVPRAGRSLLFPLKLLGLWLLAQRHWLGACADLVLAKFVSMGVTAFIFEVTRPKLLQLGLVPLALRARAWSWLAWAHGLVDPIKARIKACAAPVRAAAGGPHAAAVVAHPPPHARQRRGGAGASLRTNAPRAARTARSP